MLLIKGNLGKRLIDMKMRLSMYLGGQRDTLTVR